ncbi:uncharacterized protein LOC142981292 [Anticarsia gemmatalis]|uniref:uncharacterized protein LOC142981292 n=1 Tax=Anticarsia gemmatalis TaxID=129554 RepID=UPI003F773515
MLWKVLAGGSVQLEAVECGMDHEAAVLEGDVRISRYPWLGVLYYQYWGEKGDTRSVTTVVLVHKEFVLAAAADIGPMPKINFRTKSRVLLGEDWSRPGRRVRSYVLHPEYDDTVNTVALVQLRDVVKDVKIPPLCPPPNLLKNPEFYVIKMKDDLLNLQKEVVKVAHIPGKLCKDFYVNANLYSKRMRPAHATCVVELRTRDMCVWEAGSALAVRDLWGRWQLLGLGVRGPGCGAPARFLDMMTYYPWIESSLAKFQRITISRINKHKYVLRSSGGIKNMQRFGDCDRAERKNLLYRENFHLRTSNHQFQLITYNMTIFQQASFSCLTMELTNATSVSEMRIVHRCLRVVRGERCYKYKSTAFDITVYIMFSDECGFDMQAFGTQINMNLIDPHRHMLDEGLDYEDFTMRNVEYRGPSYMTDVGYEPLDLNMWVPEYDIWTSTEFDNRTTPTPPPMYLPQAKRTRTTLLTTTTTTLSWGEFFFGKTTTTKKTKKKPRYKTTTTVTTTTSPRKGR